MKKRDAVEYFGTEAEVARKLGITRAAVNKWRAVVPIKAANRLEKLSRGKLRLEIRDYT